MFENHMLQMFETREIEKRARLGERRVDLVPPFRQYDHGALARIAGWIRSRVSRSATPARRSATPLHP
jgi:hypothetical protein